MKLRKKTFVVSVLVSLFASKGTTLDKHRKCFIDLNVDEYRLSDEDLSDKHRMNICHVIKQEGSNNFGLFAIVYATELAHRGHPVKVVYSQGEMRSHFIVYMENGTLTPFPRKLELARLERPTALTLDII